MNFLPITSSVIAQRTGRPTPPAGGGGGGGAFRDYWTGTVYASDGSQADVQSKINSASTGDIVTIPAGSFTWSSSITFSGKGILLEGAGGGRLEGSSRTSNSIGTGSKSFTLLTTAKGNSWIDGFTVGETIRAWSKHDAQYMEGTVTSWSAPTLVLNITSTSGSGTKATWCFEAPASTEITHNAGSSALITMAENASVNPGLTGIRLIEGTGTGYGVSTSGTSGELCLIWGVRVSSIHQGIRANDVRGLVRKCYFDAGFNIGTDHTNNDNGVQATNPAGSGYYAANTVGTNDSGGTNNFYVEQCYFVGLVLGCCDFGDNCRAVMRNCIMDNSGVTFHGYDTDPVGIRQFEGYDNVTLFDSSPSIPANQNYVVAWRGGSGIVTDWYSDTISSSAWGGPKNQVQIEVQQINRGGTICATSYPATRQSGQGHNGTTYITEGIFVFSNSGAIDVDLQQYTPDDCGNGQVIGDYVQLNRDYFLRSPTTGDVLNGWAKYTYPHPLLDGI